MYESTATIGDLNDECLRQIFSGLTLKETCGVQRVRRQWKTVTDIIIDNMEELELVSSKIEIEELKEYKNAFCCPELDVFLNTGEMADKVKAFFQRFAEKDLLNEAGREEIAIFKIKKISIFGAFRQPFLTPIGLKRLREVFLGLKALNIKNAMWQEANEQRMPFEWATDGVTLEGLCVGLDYINTRHAGRGLYSGTTRALFHKNAQPKVLISSKIDEEHEMPIIFRRLERMYLKLNFAWDLPKMVANNPTLARIGV